MSDLENAKEIADRMFARYEKKGRSMLTDEKLTYFIVKVAGKGLKPKQLEELLNYIAELIK